MKKVVIILLAVTMLMLAATTTAFAADGDLIAEFGAITLDGVMDEAYTKATEIKLETKTKGDAAVTAAARCAWDTEYIYVFFSVKDSTLSTALPANTANLYTVDSVEFYIFLTDMQGSFNINEVNAAQWTAPAPITGAASFSGGGMHKTENESNASFVSVVDEGGYNVEMKIPFGNKFTATANKFINVAFSVNDQKEADDFSGSHQNSSWEGLTRAWDNTSNYRLMRLNKEGVAYVPSETSEVAFETRPYKKPTPLELSDTDTEAKTTAANDVTSKPADTEAADSGCGAVVAGGAVASVAIVALVAALKKKKEQD